MVLAERPRPEPSYSGCPNLSLFRSVSYFIWQQPGCTVQCAMLRSLLSRSPSPGINTLWFPTASGFHSHSRRNFLWLASKVEHTAVAPFHASSEPGPSTLSSTSSSASLRNPRSQGLLFGCSPITSRRHVAHPVYLSPTNVRAFHSTPRNQINPLPLLGALLKVSVPRRVRALNQATRTDLVSATLVS